MRPVFPHPMPSALRLSDLASAPTEELLRLAREHAFSVLSPELLPSPAANADVLSRTVFELRARLDRITDVEQLLALADVAGALRYATARRPLGALPWSAVWALKEETASRLKALLAEP